MTTPSIYKVSTSAKRDRGLGQSHQCVQSVCFSLVLALSMLMLQAGCASTGESGQRSELTADVGNYSPAPSGVKKPRVGVPPFGIGTTSNNFTFDKRDLGAVAADQITTLMFKTNRFQVIERAQLQQLLAEQDLEGVVKPGELAGRAKVRGVDYLLVGKVTNFRAKASRTRNGVNVSTGGIAAILGTDDPLHGQGGGYNKETIKIKTEAGVDLRLIDPTTGQVAWAEFSEYDRTDSAGSLGINVAGIGGHGDADVQISEDDAGRLLRLAFDAALKKGMPKIDRFLRKKYAGTASPTGQASPSVSSAEPSSNSAGASSSNPAANSLSDNASSQPQPTGDVAFCVKCGEQIDADAKFCPYCGAKQ